MHCSRGEVRGKTCLADSTFCGGREGRRSGHLVRRTNTTSVSQVRAMLPRRSAQHNLRIVTSRSANFGMWCRSTEACRVERGRENAMAKRSAFNTLQGESALYGLSRSPIAQISHAFRSDLCQCLRGNASCSDYYCLRRIFSLVFVFPSWHGVCQNLANESSHKPTHRTVLV